jgi:hypothetical protein
MSAGSIAVIPGTDGVSIDIVGRADVRIRGFSLAVGHDDSQLRLDRIEPGPRFADAELLTQTIRNQSTSASAPYGAFFVIFDSRAPLDRPTVDISQPTVLATFIYDVRLGATPGVSPLQLANRVFGDRPVSSIYVDAETFDVFPELHRGEVVVCSGASIIDQVLPDHGPILGETPVRIFGQGLGLGSRVFFDSQEAEIVQVSGTERLDVLVPAGFGAGAVTVTVSSGLGCASLPEGFEYEPAPLVSSVSPSEGRDGELVVRGTRFGAESRVFVGDQELSSVLVVDDGNLVADLSDCGAAGFLDVRVETVSGVGVLLNGFRCSSEFLRGECNGDGQIDLSDALLQLFILFGDAVTPACADACDLNDDGALNLADVVHQVDFLFRGGATPAEPFPSVGIDPTSDALNCMPGEEGDG